MRDTEREGVGGRDTGRGEKQAPCREPNVGLDPRSPGSGSRISAKPLSHPGILSELFLRAPFGF